MFDRGRTAKVQSQSRLTHCGTGRDDDHLTASQTTGHSIEVNESRGHTSELALIEFNLLQFAQNVL